MSKVSITTSEYKQTKQAEIDGVDFEVRPMSSAEAITFAQIAEDMQDLQEKGRTKEAMSKVDEISEVFFGLFTPENKAREIMRPLSFDQWFDIYNKIMKGSDGKSA